MTTLKLVNSRRITTYSYDKSPIPIQARRLLPANAACTEPVDYRLFYTS